MDCWVLLRAVVCLVWVWFVFGICFDFIVGLYLIWVGLATSFGFGLFCVWDFVSWWVCVLIGGFVFLIW